jgi:hypothetical protein
MNFYQGMVNFAQPNECAMPQPLKDFAGGKRPMPLLAELYEHHARECIQAAGRTDNPKYREMLLKMEREWTQAAATLQASNGSKAAE